MPFNSEKLKELRKDLKISINFITTKMNVSRRTYWLWESGRRIPNETNIRQIAKLIGVDVSIFSDLKTELPISKEIPDKILANILSSPDDLYGNILQSLYRLNTQLKQSQTIVNSFLKSIKALLYVKDTKLRYVKVNDHFRKIFDMEEDTCKGKTDEAFFSASEAHENTEEDKKVLSTGEAVQNREDFIPGTRKKRWGIISKYPLYDSQSRILGIVATFIDVTDLKNAEQRNALLHDVADQIKECIWIATFESGEEKIRYVNSSVIDYYGYTKEEILNDQYLYLNTISSEDKEKYELFLKSRDYPKSIEYRVKRANDSKELFLKESAYINGDVNFCVIRDITLEKKHQETSDLLKFMIDNFAESLAVINLSTKKYIYINNARLKLYERGAEEFYGNDINLWINKCVHPDDRGAIEFLISEAKVDTPLFYKLRIVTPSGEIKFILQKTIFKKINGQLFALSIDTLAEEQRYL